MVLMIQAQDFCAILLAMNIAYFVADAFKADWSDWRKALRGVVSLFCSRYLPMMVLLAVAFVNCPVVC